MPDDAATARTKAGMGQATGVATGSTRSLAGKCFSTAVWVAFWGFAAAAGLGGAAVSAGVAYAIAAAAGAIGVTAVICGTILASRCDRLDRVANSHAKEATDDINAFDVVSCPGNQPYTTDGRRRGAQRLLLPAVARSRPMSTRPAAGARKVRHHSQS